ncbi:DUF6907 domain-containing protein [Streptomyces sp. NBC_01803]|uniref:DUF6907 domain-containing protein n=1 Tax=Streptomyces sp. NBC_01803 TaxID=2975946 RepID=UPI002DD8D572|nr:hypothetical protein [Streptomyces sp. NBC_01803]WSA45008.1 hypothetical protein OIE51_12760 [Streptomyces sp. NBC_01803]
MSIETTAPAPVPTPQAGRPATTAATTATDAAARSTASALFRTPCYSWCIEPGDDDEPTAHESARVDLAPPPGMEGITGPLMHAVLYGNDNCTNPTPNVHLTVGTEDDPYTILTPQQADEYADRLDAFAAQVRHLARQAHEPRPEFCPEFPWCKETGEHNVHTSRELALPDPDGTGNYLGASLMAEETEGNQVSLGFEAGGGWTGLDSAGLRAEAKRIRDHCGELEKLAEFLSCEEANNRLHDTEAATR